jgi:hypothetical protein
MVHVKTLAAVAVLTLCAGLGFAAVGLAASGAGRKTAPLTPAALAQIQGNLHTAMTLELQAIADLKKGTPAAEKNLLVALRRARTDLSSATKVLVAGGFRTSPPFNPISNAGNAVGSAVSSNQASRYRLAALRNAISFETKALALLPPLAVTASTTTQTATTTGQTTTSG